MLSNSTSTAYRSVSVSNAVSFSFYCIAFIMGIQTFDLKQTGFGSVPAAFFAPLKDSATALIVGWLLWVVMTALNVLRFYLSNWLVDADDDFRDFRKQMRSWSRVAEWSLRACVWVGIYALAFSLTSRSRSTQGVEFCLTWIFGCLVLWDLFTFFCCSGLHSVAARTTAANSVAQGQGKITVWLILRSVGRVLRNASGRVVKISYHLV